MMTHVTYCNNLSILGYDDWRLPIKKELITIVDYGTYDPAIDRNFFIGTNLWYYWTADERPDDPACHWDISFRDGTIYHSACPFAQYVRCVRGDSFASNFIDNGNGSVTDNTTGLMWQQSDPIFGDSWEGAIQFCEDLNLAGYSDWRLPNIKEMHSIIDNSRHTPAIDTSFFPNARTNSQYWSSTTKTEFPDMAWTIGSRYGTVAGQVKTYNLPFVKCVRGGQ